MAEAFTEASLIASYFFTFLLFWAPLCLVLGATKYFFGALYKTGDAFFNFNTDDLALQH